MPAAQQQRPNLARLAPNVQSSACSTSKTQKAVSSTGMRALNNAHKSAHTHHSGPKNSARARAIEASHTLGPVSNLGTLRDVVGNACTTLQ